MAVTDAQIEFSMEKVELMGKQLEYKNIWEKKCDKLISDIQSKNQTLQIMNVCIQERDDTIYRIGETK